MKRQTKLTSLEHEQQGVARQQTQQPSAREFASAEEMLRHDALHTPVPSAIAQRLQESLGQLQPPVRSWWRRWLGQ